MKILQISSARVQYPGGTEKVVWELSKYLVKKGHDVTVLQTDLYEKTTDVKSFEEIDGVKIITCKNDRFLHGFGYSKEFKIKLKEIWKDFDLINIYGHGRFTSDYTLRFIGKKKPVVYSACGFFHNSKDGFFKKIYDVFFRKNIRNVKFCTALTEIEGKRYSQLGVPDEKIKVIPAWIDLNKFKGGKIDRRKVFEKWGLKNKKTLLYVGRVHESKGLQYVVEAIKDLDVNFLIVGKDADFSKFLSEKIKGFNLNDKVKILGCLDDSELITAYSASDAFVLFSSWEGFGIVVLEAIASGLPVIVSDRGALPTIIKDGDNGLIAKFPDVEELKSKIELLFKDEKFFKKIQKRGSVFVKDFEYSKVAKRYEELYERAAKE